MLTNRQYREDEESIGIRSAKTPKKQNLKSKNTQKSKMIRKINQQAVEKMRIPIGIKSSQRLKNPKKVKCRSKEHTKKPQSTWINNLQLG